MNNISIRIKQSLKQYTNQLLQPRSLNRYSKDAVLLLLTKWFKYIVIFIYFFFTSHLLYFASSVEDKKIYIYLVLL
jgi:hypothetical protein